mgnify:CR=1 FL=1
MSGISIDDLADVIMEELHSFSEEVAEGMKEEVKQVAKECAKDIKVNAPIDTGKYKKSWKVKSVFESQNDIRVVVHSGKKYRLTHLLEHGHAKRGGGRVKSMPHIKPAEENAEKKLMKKVKIKISG